LSDPTQTCTVTGPLYTDVFTIAGLSTKVTFGTIAYQTSNFQQFDVIDGVMGVAYQPVSGFNATPVLQQLVNANLMKNIFALCLQNEGGLFTLGGIDSSLYIGQISYVPLVNGLNHYNFQMQDLRVNNITLNVSSVIYNQVDMAIDTGTNGMIIPTPAYVKMKEFFLKFCQDDIFLTGICNISQNETLFDGYCFSMTDSDIKMFPPIQVVLQGEFVTQLVVLQMDGFQYLVPETQGNYCFGIQNSGYPGLTLIGDINMKPYYTIFDRINSRVGFAKVNTQNCV